MTVTDSVIKYTVLLDNSSEANSNATFLNRSIANATKEEDFDIQYFTGHYEIFILTLIFLLSIVMNSCVLLVHFIVPKMLAKSDRFVLNLVICNLMMTICVIPFAIICTYKGQWAYSESLCKILNSAFITIICATLLTILGISGNKYYAISNPLHYTSVITTTRINLCIASIWIISWLFSIIPTISFQEISYNPGLKQCFMDLQSPDFGIIIYVNLFTVIFFVFPLLLIIYMYAVMFSVTKAATKKIRRHRSYTSKVEKDANTKKYRKIYLHRDNRKAACSSFVCLVLYTLSYGSFFMLITVNVYLTLTHTKYLSYYSFSIYCIFASCVVNPIVYGFWGKYIRYGKKYVTEYWMEDVIIKQIQYKGSIVKFRNEYSIGMDSITAV